MGRVLKRVAALVAVIVSLSACSRQVVLEESSSSEADFSKSLLSIPVITEEEDSKPSEQSSSDKPPESSSEASSSSEEQPVSSSAPQDVPLSTESPYSTGGTQSAETSTQPPVEPPSSETVTPNVGAGINSSAVAEPNSPVKSIPFSSKGKYLITSPFVNEPIVTTVSIKVVDVNGNPIPNVGITAYQQTRGDGNNSYYFYGWESQEQATNHAGEGVIEYRASYASSVMLALTPPQENSRSVVDSKYWDRKCELFEIQLTRAEVQPQVTLIMQGQYSWPDAPTLEVTLLHPDNTPCVDYWCMIGQPSHGVSNSQGTGKITGNGYTDANGKLLYYGAAPGEWYLMTTQAEYFIAHDFYNHRQEFDFQINSIEDENHFVFVVND